MVTPVGIMVIFPKWKTRIFILFIKFWLHVYCNETIFTPFCWMQFMGKYTLEIYPHISYNKHFYEFLQIVYLNPCHNYTLGQFFPKSNLGLEQLRSVRLGYSILCCYAWNEKLLKYRLKPNKHSLFVKDFLFIYFQLELSLLLYSHINA